MFLALEVVLQLSYILTKGFMEGSLETLPIGTLTNVFM